MVSEKAYLYGSQRSVIRELFEYGRQRAAVVGRDAICDFSLGNPSVPPPAAVHEAYLSLLESGEDMLNHGYTSAAGCDELRTAVAGSLTRRFGMAIRPENVYVTCGAAASLSSCFGALTLSPRSEFVALAPFFPEYRCFAEAMGGTLRVVPADEEQFQIDFAALEAAIGPETQGVIVNSPNNPSGVVYTAETVRKLAQLLEDKSREYGKVIYLISDEPYRELVYGEIEVPFLPDYYANTLVCYSYSKSLSLPGERIGYVLIPDCVEDCRRVFDAVAGAARLLGYVCAPSLVQRVIARCVDVQPDLTVYERNRNLLIDSLSAMGYHCARPDGAFYLFVRSPKGSGAEFSMLAREKDVLLVPGGGFGCENWLRVSYCVDTATVQRSLDRFEQLIR